MWFAVLAGLFTAVFAYRLKWDICYCVDTLTGSSRNNKQTAKMGYRRKIENRKFYLRQAEVIWGFFKENINEENSYLPPDNVQIYSPVGTAYRTSPQRILDRAFFPV